MRTIRDHTPRGGVFSEFLLRLLILSGRILAATPHSNGVGRVDEWLANDVVGIMSGFANGVPVPRTVPANPVSQVDLAHPSRKRHREGIVEVSPLNFVAVLQVNLLDSDGEVQIMPKRAKRDPAQQQQRVPLQHVPNVEQKTRDPTDIRQQLQEEHENQVLELQAYHEQEFQRYQNLFRQQAKQLSFFEGQAAGQPGVSSVPEEIPGSQSAGSLFSGMPVGVEGIPPVMPGMDFGEMVIGLGTGAGQQDHLWLLKTQQELQIRQLRHRQALELKELEEEEVIHLEGTFLHSFSIRFQPSQALRPLLSALRALIPRPSVVYLLRR
jgi:hypothetical protein